MSNKELDKPLTEKEKEFLSKLAPKQAVNVDNEKRLVASQIILDLYRAGKIDQLEILQSQILISIKALENV